MLSHLKKTSESLFLIHQCCFSSNVCGKECLGGGWDSRYSVYYIILCSWCIPYIIFCWLYSIYHILYIYTQPRWMRFQIFRILYQIIFSINIYSIYYILCIIFHLLYSVFMYSIQGDAVPELKSWPAPFSPFTRVVFITPCFTFTF